MFEDVRNGMFEYIKNGMFEDMRKMSCLKT